MKNIIRLIIFLVLSYIIIINQKTVGMYNLLKMFAALLLLLFLLKRYNDEKK